MNPDHAHVAEWDAAYVLGALSPSDRRIFEGHLESCERCRAAVAEVTSTTGLLARVDSSRADSLLGGSDPDAQAAADSEGRAVLAALAEGTRRRRRRRWITAYAAAAVIAVALVISATVIVGSGLGPEPRDSQVVALESVAGVPIEAAVQLTSVGWGTRLDLTCSYLGDPAEGSEDGWPYGLVVIATDGTASEVSSWRAAPGSTARLSAGTALDVGQIAAIEIRSLTTDKVLMRTTLEP